MIPWGPHEIGFRILVVHWRRKWQPTPVFFPGELHEQYDKVKKIRHQMITASSPRLKSIKHAPGEE